LPTNVLIDRADWTGVQLRSIGVGPRRKNHFVYDGFNYVTQEEAMMAELLTKHGVPFTPNVEFRMRRDNGDQRNYVPDFIFNKQPFVWKAGRRTLLIHGIEVKGDSSARDKHNLAYKKAGLLWERRRIHVLVLGNAQVYWRYRQGTLPISPLSP